MIIIAFTEEERKLLSEVLETGRFFRKEFSYTDNATGRKAAEKDAKGIHLAYELIGVLDK